MIWQKKSLILNVLALNKKNFEVCGSITFLSTLILFESALVSSQMALRLAFLDDIGLGSLGIAIRLALVVCRCLTT
ncbi:hypothetical protein BpHYR1_003890 [Brachionus plicatilis]|uniref:Uncharacterized protein n=1 Tax=Brachionus plicatilis TaxID=10195 RepID=A0A3M7Q5T2_BRAPC|nr:hypothetical protein BpHYR1_003890 [Brachionus plicatilis]